MNQTSRLGMQMSFESEMIARSDNVTIERLPAHCGDIYRVKIRLDNEWILYSDSSSEKDERKEYREVVEIYG